ncbi:MAG: 5'-nucleotidase/UDP-sugar diphosphatase [Pseudohongiellaceae bacterium]|jgi:5'-nucleotidase/UDP-sugar diphosphatase
MRLQHFPSSIVSRTFRLCFFISLISLIACSQRPVGENRIITVLYTNDEHGWMEGVEESLGAANLFSVWQDQEGYTKDGPFLLLSGGDNWTGPAISTWVEGASMVDLMNTMDYDASAVGNHEFDFGLEVLHNRAIEASYPYLSANIKWRETGENLSSIAVFPYSVKEVHGIKVGIIGLTTLDTPVTTSPENVKALEFFSYEQAVRESVQQVSLSQPHLIFIISHVCIDELVELAQKIEDLNIDLIGAGHCNELLAEKQGSAVMLGGGSKFQSYAKARFVLDTNGEITDVSYSAHRNIPAEDDAQIVSLVSQWREVSEEALSVSLGFNAVDLEQNNTTLRQAIIDSWLIQYPIADIAITNAGGLREGLQAGEISFGDVFNIMPFDNTIIAVDVPGHIILEVLASGTRPVKAGLRDGESGPILIKTGEPLEMQAIYRVLINSFMYQGGDNYGPIAEFDPNGVDTEMSYRQPFISWLQGLATNSLKPLRL